MQITVITERTLSRRADKQVNNHRFIGYFLKNSKIFFQYGAFCRGAGRCILSDRNSCVLSITNSPFNLSEIVGLEFFL